MHKISFENIVEQQSHQSLNIKDTYFAVSSTAYCSHSVTFRRNRINSKHGVEPGSGQLTDKVVKQWNPCLRACI